MADESYPQKVPLNGSVVVPGQPPVTPSAPPNSSPQHSAFSQADGSPVRQAPKPAAPYRKAPDIVPFERRNWLIHWYYVKKEFESCKAVIQAQLEESAGLCEYALYVHGLISRLEGKIEMSLAMFQTCCLLSPSNVNNLKQVARSLFLLGRHKAAIEVYEDAAKLIAEGSQLGGDAKEKDWEIAHNQGICHIYLAAQGNKQHYDLAKSCLKQAISCSKHDLSFTMLAKVYLMEGDYELAIETYKRAIEYFPDNSDLLTTLGLLYLHVGDHQKAFENLGSALAFDPVHSKAILAAGSIIQTHGDFEVALTKYRISAVKTKESAPLWNNIGLCFYGKKKLVACVSCLKRALYLAPFDWKILYNLGLVHLSMGQHASAFTYLSASINNQPKCAAAFMLLGMTLANLEDTENASKSYESAISLNDPDPLIPLNYCAFAYQQGNLGKANQLFQLFNKKLSDKKQESPSFKLNSEMEELVQNLEPALHLGEAAVMKSRTKKSNPQAAA